MGEDKKYLLKTDDEFLMLREINANPRLTQRDLSGRLGLSLGKVNFLIKALVDKGLVKAENFKNSRNKMAYLYYLTPKGIEQKTHIACHFLKRKMLEYEKLRHEISELEKEVDLPELTIADR
ncbi:MAG: MarR family EPS-associated transcriptional regulator [Smithellaceae bacterium]|jgi:EPS-associated MarR family transcriptional regulator|nr:MarR family EPS-associated transcriptional regulator [Smithellaceae bacterium]HQF84566.1 MarR family EPS-associated transcriptional regulator [Smithellaceae bacterium]HQG81067.1 MarR family EPS-associated transcriptional regulator [Smithellaceae bacterium]